MAYVYMGSERGVDAHVNIIRYDYRTQNLWILINSYGWRSFQIRLIYQHFSPVMNYYFRKYTEANQSLWDYIFGAYLVTHTPTGEETGWTARFERMGDYVEKRQEKAAEKKAAKESGEDSKETKETESKS